MPTPAVRFPELGYYTLPGHVAHPGQVVEEVRAGAALGLGSVWISERLNTKSVEVLSGVAAAQDHAMGIAAGLIANLPLRHPLVVAAYGSTMSLLTGGRFALGIGRGQAVLADTAGVPRLDFKLLEDWITLLRALWRGETVNYAGPAGNLTGASLGIPVAEPPPIVMAPMGDRTCYWAGRWCDAVVYNSLWTAEAVAHSTRLVRQGAAEAGRDPDAIRVWTIGVAACDLSEDDTLNIIVRRMNTYVALGDLFDNICRSNHWDRAVLDRVRAIMFDPGARERAGSMGDEHVSRDLDIIRRCADIYPHHWIDDGCLVGSPAHCVDGMLARIEAGADAILLHGSVPQQLGSLVDEWARRRPRGRFDGHDANPGVSPPA
ncbi:MAG: TIGR03857 family LLM class F420-dependent oxidoreductase [Gammaproteobacteria bacterium]|nr:TIGR03857 family LLM class F420-dependent oxidoreductase [Gammaproteobacteria bacterium]